MKQSSIMNHGLATAALTLALLAMVPAVRAEDSVTVNISLKDHRFQPAELHAPAGKPITIILKNLDPVPAEFESRMLRVEKVVTGGPHARLACDGAGGAGRGLGDRQYFAQGPSLSACRTACDGP